METKEELERIAASSPLQAAPWLALAQHCTNALDWAGAERAYAHLHRLAPQHGGIARNWLRTMGEQGKSAQAIAIAARFLEQAPDDAAMWKRVATLAHEGRHWESEAQARRNLVRLEPDLPEHPYRLACALLELDNFEQARAVRTAARLRWPANLPLLWLDVATHHAIPENVEQIAEDRANSEAALREAETWQGDATDAFEGLGRSHFYSAYHGENERARSVRVAQQIERIAYLNVPKESFVSNSRRVGAGQKVRVAMVSLFWHRHTIAHYFGGWLQYLDRSKFEVALAGDGVTRDDITVHLETVADAILRPSKQKSLMREIEAWQPDVVIFIDVGMVGKHMPMFAYRLAPIQLAAWGHPVTTGFSQIDGYITVRAMEPPNWRNHYSEREVIQLPGQGIFYTPPSPPEAQSRSYFGLPETASILCCAQSLFKIHPCDEALFCKALLALPNAHLVLFALGQDNATKRFRLRFERTLERFSLTPSRITLLPQMAHTKFLQVLMLSDVVLDTHHFSGGKTSLDALTCGVPIVTWPGEFMRGRQTAGMLTLIGETESLARDEDDYVRKVSAIAAGDVVVYRAQLRARAQTLFNDEKPIRALEDHLLRLCNAA